MMHALHMHTNITAISLLVHVAYGTNIQEWGRFPLKTEVSPLQEFILPTHLIQHFPILGDTRKAYSVTNFTSAPLSSGVTRVQMKPGQLPNTKLIIIMIIVN